VVEENRKKWLDSRFCGNDKGEKINENVEATNS
jgi:hypothetical protein